MLFARSLPPPPMTVAEFLTWEETQELCWEFDGIQPSAMTGGTVAHEVIQNNLVASLNGRLRGSACRAYGSTLKIEAAGAVRYPDAFIACSPLPPRDTVCREPVVVFEVISPSTARTDRVAKMRDYWDAPSIRRYVIIEQDAISATSYIRQDGRWVGRVLWAGDMIELPEAGISLALEDLYEGLDPEELRRPASGA